MNWFKEAAKKRKPRRGDKPPPLTHRHRHLIWVYRSFVKPNNRKELKVSEFEFLSWLSPSSPAYSEQLNTAIQEQQWGKIWGIVSGIQQSIKSGKGIYPAAEKPSNHELVVRDILYIIGESFRYQTPYSVRGSHDIIPDFQLGDGRIFEIFGFRSDDYRERSEIKYRALYDILWWLDLIDVSIKSSAMTLLRYAKMLDNDVCHRDRCDLSLFSESVEESLKQEVPLLLGQNFSLCRNYLIQVGGSSDEWVDQKRKSIQELEPITRDAPEYVEPEESQTLFSRAQILLPKTLTDITSHLQSKYLSVNTWSDEEKIAIYFKTPKNLIMALPNAGQQGKMVAAMKETKKPKSKGTVTFDFDRTMVRPVGVDGSYMYYGLEPNYPMIEKMKDYARRGYIVGIVTSRVERFEQEDGSQINANGEPAVAVKDFIKEHNLPVSFVHFTNWARKTETLKAINSIKHYDDDEREIELCKENGIRCEHIVHPEDKQHGDRL